MSRRNRITEKSQESALATIRGWVKPGDSIYAIVRHVSSSGMSRQISFFFVKDKDTVICLDYNISLAMGHKIGKHDGLIVSGCGMDMAFHTIYSLSRWLYPEGFGIMGEKDGKKKRPKTKAEAARMVTEGWEFRGRNGDQTGWDTDGGYALNKRNL